jgi:quercetin dioxygenase-like cupin family protein
MKIVKVAPAWSDARGSITDLLNDVAIRHIGLIDSKAGAVRGNHFHRQADQYAYILRGRVRYYERPPGHDVAVADLEVGDLVFTRAGVAHTLQFLEDSLLLVLTTHSRAANGFEDDTIRLDPPLVRG